MKSPDIAALDRRADLLVDAQTRLLDDLIAFRKKHKLTQQEVAERMGVTQPTIAAFESYDANPTITSIMRYAMAVGVLIEFNVVDDSEGVTADQPQLGSGHEDADSRHLGAQTESLAIS